MCIGRKDVVLEVRVLREIRLHALENQPRMLDIAQEADFRLFMDLAPNISAQELKNALACDIVSRLHLAFRWFPCCLVWVTVRAFDDEEPVRFKPLIQLVHKTGRAQIDAPAFSGVLYIEILLEGSYGRRSEPRFRPG